MYICISETGLKRSTNRNEIWNVSDKRSNICVETPIYRIKMHTASYLPLAFFISFKIWFPFKLMFSGQEFEVHVVLWGNATRH